MQFSKILAVSIGARPSQWAAVLAAVLLAGCAGAPGKNADPGTDSVLQAGAPADLKSTAALAEKDVQCHNERVTGSHMIKTVCTTAEQRKDMEAAAKQWMRTGGRSGGVSRVRDSADPRDTDEDD